MALNDLRAFHLGLPCDCLLMCAHSLLLARDRFLPVETQVLDVCTQFCDYYCYGDRLSAKRRHYAYSLVQYGRGGRNSVSEAENSIYSRSLKSADHHASLRKRLTTQTFGLLATVSVEMWLRKMSLQLDSNIIQCE